MLCISCNVMRVEQWFAFAKVEYCCRPTLFLVCMISQILDLDSLYQWSGCSSQCWNASITSCRTFLPCYDVFLSGNELSEKKNCRMGLGSRHYLLDLETWALHSKMAMSARLKEQSLSWKLCPVMAFFLLNIRRSKHFKIEKLTLRFITCI